MSKRYREVLEEVETPASRRAADRDVVAVADESHEPTTAVTADRPDEAGTGMATDDHDPGTAPGMGTGGGVATLVRPATTDMSSPKQETGRCERSEATSGGNSGTLRAQRSHLRRKQRDVASAASNSNASGGRAATPTRPEDAQQLQRVRRTRDDRALTAAHRHAAAMARRRAGRRADALFELATGTRAGTFTPIDPDDPSGRADRVPSVLLTCHVDTLIGDGAGMPAHVLTRLAGRMKVTADVARRWVARGAATRLIAVDNLGEVVGVGTRRRFATGWLRDAVVARDLHDTAPASTTPARLCDVDHVEAWPDGPTDLPNLTLVSRRTHTAKTDGNWRLDRHRDGTRTWTATRSGYQVRQPRPTHLPRPPDLGTSGSPPAGKDPPDPRAP